MRIVRTIVITLGVLAFAWTAHELGWSGLTAVLVKTGWWFVVIAAIDVCSAMCDAAAIRCFAHRRVSFGRALAAQLAGVAINRVTPGNALGEPIKIGVLAARMPRDIAVSAILMFDVAAVCVAITAIVLGVPITLSLVELPGKLAAAAWIGAGVLVMFALVVIYMMRRGLVRAGIVVLRRIRVIDAARAERWRPAAANIDAMVRELGRPGMRVGFLGLAGSRAFNWLGTIVMLCAAGQALTPSLVVGIVSVGALVTYLSHVVPLGLGVAEGGNYLLYRALGAPGFAAFDFTMVYRARTCVLAAIGLTVLAFTGYRDRRRRATVEQ